MEKASMKMQQEAFEADNTVYVIYLLLSVEFLRDVNDEMKRSPEKTPTERMQFEYDIFTLNEL